MSVNLFVLFFSFFFLQHRLDVERPLCAMCSKETTHSLTVGLIYVVEIIISESTRYSLWTCGSCGQPYNMRLLSIFLNCLLLNSSGQENVQWHDTK